MLGLIFLSICRGIGEREREREMKRERCLPLFVIQSHSDSKLFEVLSREIDFDHEDLMN